MKIGIDIDDTISDSIERWIYYADKFEEENPNVVKEKITKFQLQNSHNYLEEFYKWDERDKEIFFNKYSNSMLKTVKIKENASSVINKLKEEGHKIYIVTSRFKIRDNSDAENITINWLKNYGVQYDKIYFNASNTKLQICNEESIKLFIDDNYEVCKTMINNDIKALKMNSKYNNINDDTIPRVNNWKEVYNKIQQM